MVLIASTDNDMPYEPFLLEEKHFMCPQFIYPDTYPEYNLNQPSYPEPIGDMTYSNWNSTLVNTTGSCFQNHNIFEQPSARIYTEDVAPIMQIDNYHQAWHDFGFNQGTPMATAFAPFSDSRILMSPYGDFDYYTQYPQAAWSPSEQSAASLSPPSNRSLEQDVYQRHLQDSGAQEEELLQGLGLYDCPELMTDDRCHIDPNSGQLGLGKGLKLEESFELNEEYLENSGSLAQDEIDEF
ncbi:hypothetical protein TWF696_007116 [Orbilia brochopaga]|uniref:Uncharacterized protein n=1 Tax=Orbilia brochopaga TaxID=3140254 RepID=A0AAV9UXJ4_9PEZI